MKEFTDLGIKVPKTYDCKVCGSEFKTDEMTECKECGCMICEDCICEDDICEDCKYINDTVEDCYGGEGFFNEYDDDY